MTHDKRLELILKVCGDMYRLAETKGIEYSNGGDALGNFKRVAAELDISPEMACWVYTKKHLDAIASYVRTGQEFSTENIDGRIHDAALYLILLLGIIQEKREEKKSVFDEIIYLPEGTEREVIENLEKRFDGDLAPDLSGEDCDEDEDIDEEETCLRGRCHCDMVDAMMYSFTTPYILKDEPLFQPFNFRIKVRGE